MRYNVKSFLIFWKNLFHNQINVDKADCFIQGFLIISIFIKLTVTELLNC